MNQPPSPNALRTTKSQRKALNIERHICVTAGAGSGKTRVLVERYLGILRKTDAKPNEIVAITFTDKAAAEMKKRITDRLAEDESGDAQWHREIAEQISAAPISTIHAFCSRILREFPFQAGVPANFGILHGIDQKLLLQTTVQDELKEIATNAADADRGELTRLLRCYGSRKQLEKLLSKMVEERELVERLKSEVYADRSNAEIRGTWGVEDKPDVEEWLRCLNTVLKGAKGKNAPAVQELTEQLEQENQAAEKRDSVILDILSQIAPLIRTKSGTFAKKFFLGLGVETNGIESEIEFLMSASETLKDMLSDDNGFLIDTTRHVLHLYTRIETAYRRAKLAQGQLDYTDLQLKLRDLLRNSSEIRDRLRERYRYFMVDEYQDTNPLQAELVMLLTDDLTRANLFIVGDAKQGIYGFRGADIRVFDQTREKIAAMQGESIRMEENFRSLRHVVAFVNLFFHNLMGDGSESDFEVAYERLVQGRPAPAEKSLANNRNYVTRDIDNVDVGLRRETLMNQPPSSNALRTTEEIEIILGQKGDEAVDENELIAKRVTSLMAEGFQVWDKDDEVLRPIRYGDIAILIRSRTHLPDIENALLKAKVPYLTTGGIGFYQRQEIYDMWNYLHILDTPEEGDVSLAAVLRAPFFGISDAELYEIARQPGDNFWQKAEARLRITAEEDAGIDSTEMQDLTKSSRPAKATYSPSQQLNNALRTIKRQRELAKRIPVNQLLLTIVNDTGMIGTLATGRQGPQRWANYQKLLELARNFQKEDDKPTLTGFIEFLRVLIDEEPREGQAPVQLGDKAVNIMTIHAAKGLEFPVVILPGLARAPQGDREPFIDEELGIGFSPRNPDKDYAKTEPSIVAVMKNRARAKAESEKKRLFYVGATRARDRLILAGSLEATGKQRNMLEWLYTHIGIGEQNALCLPVELDVYADNSTSTHCFNLPIRIFRNLGDIPDGETQDEDTVIAGMPELPLGAGTPQTSGAAYSVTALGNYARCSMRYQLENVLRIPNAGHEASDEENNYDETEAPDWDGTQMGRAVHFVLAKIRQQSELEALDELIRWASREYRHTSEVAIRGHVDSFLNSELGQTALASAETNRCEQQIYAALGEHLLVGRLDRIFKDAAGQWQLIDYKTGATSEMAIYRPQMELYAWLMHQHYPAQPEVAVNLFFTAQNQCETLRFSRDKLQELAARLQKTIANLQQGRYEKNHSHCPFCPYADADNRCLVSPEVFYPGAKRTDT